MKILLILLTAIIATAQLSAQDCTSVEDCLNKTKTGSGNVFGYYDRALKFAKKEGVNPTNIYFNRGVSYYKLYTPDYKEAEKDFKASIKADPNNVWAYMWLSNVYAYGEKDHQKAVDFLTELIPKFPNDVRIFRERANINKNFNKLNLATTDYEMAYNLIISDPSIADAWTISEVCRWHAELNKQARNLKFADEEIVTILENGLEAAPDDALLLGELALAYFDIGKEQQAKEFGRKAHAINKSTVGSLFVAIDAHDKADYRLASTLMYEARNAAMRQHPLINFYFGVCLWAHVFNNAKNSWSANKELIRSNLQAAVSGAGTQYDWYAQEAKRQLARID